MTTGTSRDDRRRAAELLDVAEDAPREEVRRAYLERLRDHDFQPPRSLRHALRVLEGRVAPGIDEDRVCEEEARLRVEVESFGEEFFGLPPEERRRRWDALSSACRGAPPLAARLRALRAGLDVEIDGHLRDGSFFGLLAEQMLRDFALPPTAQAASRQAFLLRIEEPTAEAERPTWEKAARRLRADWPAVAALDEEFVRHVAELRRRLGRRAGRPRREVASAVEGESDSWWAAVIVAIIIAGVGAIYGHSTKSDPSPAKSGYTKPVPPDLERGPALRELCDPSQFDVELIGTRKSRTFRFTPRPGSANAGGGPLMYGEVILRLRGATPAHLNGLTSRAERAGHRGDVPKTPPERVDPQPPPAEKARP